MSLFATTYIEHTTQKGMVMLIPISPACGVVSTGLRKSWARLFSCHISTTELPEQQETLGNKKDLND